jgi:hypothetical protein
MEVGVPLVLSHLIRVDGDGVLCQHVFFPQGEWRVYIELLGTCILFSFLLTILQSKIKILCPQLHRMVVKYKVSCK